MKHLAKKSRRNVPLEDDEENVGVVPARQLTAARAGRSHEADVGDVAAAPLRCHLNWQ